MKQFTFDTMRGVFVGIIVWYLLRPDEPAFDRFSAAIDNGKAVSSSISDLFMSANIVALFNTFPPSQIAMAGVAGAAISILYWMFTAKSRSQSKQRSAADAKNPRVRGKPIQSTRVR